MSTAVPATKSINPLLAKYLAQLQTHPLRTKALTSGAPSTTVTQALALNLPQAALSFFQEILGSQLAGVPVKKPPKDAHPVFHVLARAHVDTKALKMATYGLLVSAPLSHYLFGLLQKAFAGRSGPRAKVAQILASNVLISPIQTAGEHLGTFSARMACLTVLASAFLASMAVINGAKSTHEVIAMIKKGFVSVIRVRSFGSHRPVFTYAFLDHVGRVAAVHGGCAGLYPRRGTFASTMGCDQPAQPYVP
jgi:peroxisomal membrane protein 2